MSSSTGTIGPAGATTPRHLVRTVTLAACTVALVCVAALVAVRLAGLDDGTFLALPVSGLPYAAVAAVLVLVVAAVLRARLLAITAAVLVAVLVALLLPRFIPDGTEVPAGAPAIRVATSNTLHGRIDASALADLVRTQRVDVLAVQELTPAGVHAIDAAGITKLLPYHVVHSGADTALYSRLPIERGGEADIATSWPLATARVIVGGKPVELVAVHTYYPLGDARRWAADLRALRAEAGKHAVLLGDFNATLEHAPMRELLGAGLIDTHAELGEGWAPTWPARGASPVPLIQLDHVLHGAGLAAEWAGEYELPGSDHRAVVAELAVR